jgi:metal-responsive CopG/Arc/MetJ family transcriptional regulator
MEKGTETKRYSMFFTENFLKKLDEVKVKKGFKHRSNVIMYLLNIALDMLTDIEIRKFKGDD